MRARSHSNAENRNTSYAHNLATVGLHLFYSDDAPCLIINKSLYYK
jgi:hypothetical protein